MTAAGSEINEVPDLDYGVPLGACQGVVAYSNLDSYYFSGEKHFCQGVFTGFKYQCVEYARRHMLTLTGCIFGQCGPAHEIFDMTEVTSVVTKDTHKWHACANGTTAVKPKAGMTLVYPIDKKMPVGHVAVIAEVGEDWLGIAEENEGSKPWNGKSYGRKLPLVHDTEKDTWTLVETDPGFVPSRGWLYIDGVEPVKPLPGITEADLTIVNETTIEEKVYPKHNVSKDLIEAQGGPKKLARFHTPSIVPAVVAAEESTRRPLLEEYLKVVSQGATKLAEGQFDNAEATYLKQGHSGVKRRGEISTIYAPNQEVGVASIGMCMRSFRLIETCLEELLVKSGESDEAIAQRYKMPVELVGMAKKAFTADSSNSSAALSQVDFALGTMGLAYDNQADAFRILHTEFDTLPYLMEMNAFQEPYVYGTAKFESCWVMTSYGYDFHRSVRNFQKFKLGNKKADEVLYSIDFGSVADLSARGISLDEDEAYTYTVERLNQLYTIEYLKEVLIEKKKDFEAGDIADEDLPKWSIQSIDFWDDKEVKFEDGGDGKVFVGDKEAKLMWKCMSWKFLFQLAKSSDRVKGFVTTVGAKNIGVFQPVWTHIAAQPRFLYDLAVWAEKQDSDLTLTDIGKPLDFVIPSKNWTQGPEGPCSAVITPPATTTNPTLNGEPYKQATVDTQGPRATYSYAALHCLVAGGKRSAGLWLESKSNDKDEGGVRPTNGVHPAPAPFMRTAIGFD